MAASRRLPAHPNAPELAECDVFVANHSGGKDSLAMLDVVAHDTDAAGVLNRVVVQHNDLGRVEWPGAREIAQQHAEHYGLRFEVRSRRGPDLLDDIRRRGKFPDAARRWCTSDHKRGPGRTLLTELTRELALARPARIVQCYGFRAQESPGRAAKEAFAYDQAASTQTTRHVWTWLPILGWTVDQVWNQIRASGMPHHPAYDEGMSRLSCSFCVLASRRDLLTACRLRPDLAREYAAVEAEIRHRFRQDLSMARILDEAGV
ncbi:phosphoadenosine phosphosulfate reductase family protein [Micromonospora sp. WMMD1082]|uniref:phosphoadenosine phosphosulfate reductase family protein n=1 Tax=Micromonospora sp. WMMD1082 TaxID=3016104 RepID=UPI00241627F6|nr:phosphoadenosine phosphosulfate reductase family protein [Micromonospora sp. WMMD1082]MDG4796900.1 phosphoadenosine phosphosulfate reductase family protein [Micromonospora sp. WMMD1082]